MLRASCASAHVGLLWWLLSLWGADGLIEIVEEQRCHDYQFRLICRELDSHIAVLEAWYVAMDDYYRVANTTRPPEPVKLPVKSERDAELDRVYVYSSPRHDGVYLPANGTESFTVANNSFSDNVSGSLEDFVDETVEMAVDFVVGTEACSAPSFLRSYGSWREGDKRRKMQWRWNSSGAVNLRAPVTYRCTGVNHCSFILAKDYPPAVSWSSGLVYIKYACFDDSMSLHYCNREVRIADQGPDSEGYIRTPGYPHFYIGDKCRWRLRANPEQRIRVTLMDVSLRSIGPFEEHCMDYVAVTDSNGEALLSSCDQVELPLRITSSTNEVDIAVEAKSKGAFPKRGVLLHYKSVGCVTLPAPSDGYLVYRNEDFAHYMCNVNLVFVDTRQRARVMWCYDDNRWNDTVPLCVDLSAADKASTNITAGKKDLQFTGDNKQKNLPSFENNMIVDIVIPSLLIAALFIGNAFIVLIIYKYRKRKNEDLEDEFNTIPLSSNGNVHSAGNAV